MPLKTLSIALVLMISPLAAMAQCRGSAHEEAAMSCAEGTTYDLETRTCVPIVNS